MSYDIDIHRMDVSYYSESGEWLDGDRREIRDHGTDTESYDSDDADEYGSPVAWALARINRTTACEPNQAPIPAELNEHAWLSGTYEHPYTGHITETSVRLTGEWTPVERAEVFRGVVLVTR